MSAPESLVMLVGKWVGRNSLSLSPEEAAYESDSAASVAMVAQGQFLTIQYTWSFDGKPQEGLLILGYEKKRDVVKAVWIDSWHMSDKFMVCKGSSNKEGVISVQGSYSAPPGPDWGWRTIIDPEDGISFRILMYNIWPDGKEELAVEATFVRQGFVF